MTEGGQEDSLVTAIHKFLQLKFSHLMQVLHCKMAAPPMIWSNNNHSTCFSMSLYLINVWWTCTVVNAAEMDGRSKSPAVKRCQPLRVRVDLQNSTPSEAGSATKPGASCETVTVSRDSTQGDRTSTFSPTGGIKAAQVMQYKNSNNSKWIKLLTNWNSRQRV